jgi:hypothetical protein
MHHQYWHGGVVEERPRDAAKYLLSKTPVTERADNE